MHAHSLIGTYIHTYKHIVGWTVLNGCKRSCRCALIKVKFLFLYEYPEIVHLVYFVL